MQSSRERHFRTGFLVTWAVQLVVLCPLLFHLSDEPAVGPYSAAYAAGLAGAALASLGVAALAGQRCRASGSRGPALAAITVILSVWFAGFVVECGLRVFQPDASETFATYREWGHRKSPLFGFEADFVHEWTKAGATYRTDSSGFRRHVQDPDWRNDRTTKRLFVLGESSVFGYGLDDDETWPHRLEDKLRSRKPPLDYAVINAGNNGHNSLQSMLRFYVRVVPERPDTVIYYAAINDVMNARLEHDAIWITSDILFTDSLGTYLRKTRRHQNLYARSVLGVMLARAWDALRGVPPAPPRPEPDPSPKGEPKDIRARFGRNLVTLVDMCRRAGARPILTTFIYDRSRLERSYAEGIRIRNEMTRHVARNEGVDLVDLERAFAATPNESDYFFEDAYHPNERGAEWIASTLAERIPELLARPPDVASARRGADDGSAAQGAPGGPAGPPPAPRDSSKIRELGSE